MVRFEIGQLVEVDLFGLQLSGAFIKDTRSVATVVGLGPGTISVRVQLEGRSSAEVTVSSGRIVGEILAPPPHP